MINDLYWLPISEHLCDFLQTYKLPKTDKGIFDDVVDSDKLTIGVGSLGNTRSYPSLEILFDSETKDKSVRNRGEVNLWLDAYIDSSGTKLPVEAYRMMYLFTNAVMNSLIPWQRDLLAKNNISTIASIPNVLSDGDLDITSSCMVRMLLSVSYVTKQI